MSPLKNDPVTTLLALLRDPLPEVRVQAASLILDLVAAEELAELKKRVAALEARQKQRRTQ